MLQQQNALRLVRRRSMEDMEEQMLEEAMEGHLVRLCPLNGQPMWFRRVWENWQAVRETVEYGGVLEESAPLVGSAEIFGRLYPMRKRSFLIAFPVQLLLVLLLALAFSTRTSRRIGVSFTRASVTPLALHPSLQSPNLVANKFVIGGGGGGARAAMPASHGKLPKFATHQFVPPAVQIAPAPMLAVKPTLVDGSKIPIVQIKLPVWGEPLSKLLAPSDGPGFASGIGAGVGGGVGDHAGPGYGEGFGGVARGAGGSVAGGGVIPPRATHRVSPVYTAEAYAARIAGKVILQINVQADGSARVVRVLSGLPMGLTEKAIEAVELWTFQAGRRNGQPIAMEAEITIFFRP